MNTKINFYAKESIIKYTSKSLEMKIKKVYKNKNINITEKNMLPVVTYFNTAITIRSLF